MSSPFSQKFMSKNPIAQTARQKANLPKAVVNAIAEEQGNPSPVPMHHGSPAEKHDPKAIAALEAKLARVKKGEEGAEGQGGVDYELQVQVEKQIKEAKGDHKMKKKLKA